MYRLAEDAKFIDAREAILVTAKKQGFSDSQILAMADAFDAVGITEPDTLRISLSWGPSPSDLDSHFVGDGFHVYYGDETAFDDDGKLLVDLDRDDTDSFGPEIITLHERKPGTYYYYVHDFTDGDDAYAGQLGSSGAVVRVYKRGELIGRL